MTPQRSPNRLGVILACGAIAVGFGLALVVLAIAIYLNFRPPAAPTGPAVEYILDSSPRMAQPAENDTGTRLAVAQGVLAEIVRPADTKVTAGLRVFGSGAQPQGCQDTDLLVPLAAASQGQISTHLLSLTSGPNPDAALAEAMVAAIRDLGPTTGPHSLVVVTGGDDSCNAEAGQLVAAEATRAGITLRLFVVGYQVPADQGDAIKGLVDDASPTGAYINTNSKAELTRVLAIIQQAVDNPGTISPADVVNTATAVAPTETPSPVLATETPAPPSATPGPAATLSLLDAAQLVIDQVVQPVGLTHDIIVHAWPTPLVPGDLLQPFPFPGPTPPPIPTPIGVESWFFWVDDVPAGKFSHPSRFVLVDRTNGALSVSDAAYWPTLNGQGLWTNAADYWNPADWVFSSLTWTPTGSRPGSGALAAPAQQPPPQARGAAALVINGWQTDQPGLLEFAADAAQMIDALAGERLAVTYLGPAQDANAERDGEANRENISAWFNLASATLGRGDSALIYITGHTLAPQSGAVTIAGLSAGDLAQFLGQFQAGVNVILVLDGSYSGALLPAAQPVADMIITSTDGQTPGTFDIDPAGDPNLSDRGSEFTSSFAAGLGQSGGDPLTRLRSAFGIALRLDAAAITGLTHPQIWPERAPATNTPPPTITPTPTETPTPTPTPLPAIIYRVQVSLLSDEAEQSGKINMPEVIDLILEKEGTADFSGPAPWVRVTGHPNSDGFFQSTGHGTVEGIEDVEVFFEGRFVAGRLSGEYTFGSDGKLANEQSVTYRIVGGRLQSSLVTPVPTISSD